MLCSNLGNENSDSAILNVHAGRFWPTNSRFPNPDLYPGRMIDLVIYYELNFLLEKLAVHVLVKFFESVDRVHENAVNKKPQPLEFFIFNKPLKNFSVEFLPALSPCFDFFTTLPHECQ